MNQTMKHLENFKAASNLNAGSISIKKEEKSWAGWIRFVVKNSLILK
jgi:hypothetical protein